MYGIILEFYYKISVYFVMMLCIDNGKELEYILVRLYLIYLILMFGIDIVKKYLDLVLVKWNELRGFMLGFKDIK